MTFILWGLAAFGACLLVAWIVHPLFAARTRWPATSQQDEEIERLVEEKTSVYRAMLDLEFDHRVGKVSDSDYSIMRSQHEADALSILKELDTNGSDESLIDELEQEIASARKKLLPE